MFDLGYSELLLIAVVALVVIGPKDLPKALRVVGQWMGKGRAMARHMRSGFDEMMRQAEMEEMEKQWKQHNAAIMKASADEAPMSAREGFAYDAGTPASDADRAADADAAMPQDRADDPMRPGSMPDARPA